MREHPACIQVQRRMAAPPLLLSWIQKFQLQNNRAPNEDELPSEQGVVLVLVLHLLRW